MAEIQIDDPNISGYAFYEGGMIVRAVLINSNAYFGGARPSARITLNIPGEMEVKRLAIG